MTDHFFVFVPLLADAGIPMIILTWPAMVALLVPVIVIEGLLCRNWLRLEAWKAIKINAVSNLVSTVVGIPLAWAFMLLIELGALGVVSESRALQNWHSPIANAIFLVVSSAWLNPDMGEKAWFVPAATLVLLVPFFFVSYWIEYLVVRRMLRMSRSEEPNLGVPLVRGAVRNANLVTYGVMFFGVSIWLGMSLHHH